MSEKKLGIVYTGTSPHGIQLQLFRSYKTIKIRPDKPYVFEPGDDTSVLARQHYAKYAKSLSIRVTDNQEELLPKPVVRRAMTSQISKIVPVVPLAGNPDADPELKKLEAENNEDTNNTNINTEVNSAQLNSNGLPNEGTGIVTGPDGKPLEIDLVDVTLVNIADLNDSELAEYIDTQMNKDQLKELATKLNIEINARKSEANIVSDMVATSRDKLVAYFSTPQS